MLVGKMTEKSTTRLGFIGLGAMGLPMVKNLGNKLPQDAVLHVLDISQDAMDAACSEFPETRMKQCVSPKHVAERSDIILTMLPEGSHVREVYIRSTECILSAPLNGKLLIDCSTIDTQTSIEVKEKIASRYSSASFYDAPVSGGVIGAENATMTFMLGCSEEDSNLPRIRTLLQLMGGQIFACGGPSLGLTAKLCNNYCSGLIAIATSEALSIGIGSGMDPRVLAKVFSVSLAQSCINDKWNPVPGICPDAPASNGYKPGFKVGLMRKDFNLAVETARRVGVNLCLGEPGLEVYTKAMNDDKCKDLDSRVIFRYLGGDEEWEKKLSR